MTSFAENDYIFEPKEVLYENTLGMYPLPIFANIQNTGDRLQETANQVGFPILASDLFLQSKKTIFDMQAKKANSPESPVYQDMSKRRSEYFNTMAGVLKANTRIGIGDSLGVPAIQGMQLYGETESTFDAIVLRDGWNLSEPVSGIRGIGRYALYQIKDALYSRKHPNRFTVPDHGFNSYIPDGEDETNPIHKLLNVADLMRGNHNFTNALKLSEHVVLRGLALNIVCLRNGLSGPENVQHAFLDSMDAMLGVHLIMDGKDIAEAQSLPYKGSIVDGWHSDLLDPTRAANDIKDTLALLEQ